MRLTPHVPIDYEKRGDKTVLYHYNLGNIVIGLLAVFCAVFSTAFIPTVRFSLLPLLIFIFFAGLYTFLFWFLRQLIREYLIAENDPIKTKNNVIGIIEPNTKD